MGHKIKFRVTINGGKGEKIGFTLEEGKSFRLNGKLPGMAILSSLVPSDPSELVQVGISHGALVATQAPVGPKLVLNGRHTPETKIRTGDILTFENGKIEFLEAPFFVEEEDSTRMVDLTEVDPSTRMVDLGQLEAAAQSSEAAPAMDDATAFIMAEKVPEALARAKAQIQAQAAKTRKAPSKKDESADSKNEGFNPSKIDWAPWKHLGASAAVIGFCGETAARIAYHFKYASPPIPTPLSGALAVAIAAIVSGIFFYADRYLETFHQFKSYLRTFAWFSIYLIPFACAFGFPNSVVILAGIMLASVWTGLFSIKYFQHLPKFIPASAAAWILIFGIGFHAMSRDANREIASTHADIEDLAEKISNMPAPSASVMPDPIAVANPSPAPVPVTEASKAPSNQEIAHQSEALALDPMAQEQFFNAVKSGNLKLVQSLVDRHVVDPVFTLDHGSSALHYAASQGDIRLVQYLISKRVNVDAQDAGGTTPLMWAVYKQHLTSVDFLLKHKANPLIRREGGDRALEIAKAGNDRKILALVRQSMKVMQAQATAAKNRQIASLKTKKKHKRKSTQN